MKRLLHEPLIHFLLLGGAMFIAYGFFNRPDSGQRNDKIIVSAGRIEQLRTVFMKTWQRPPSREELEGLIDDFLLEEVYYRQAVSMGIDRDDTVIRRRLRQKLEFLTDDASALMAPSDADLEEYLTEHAGQFRLSPEYTFRQVYFNPEKHGSDPESYVSEQLKELVAGQVVGDPSLVPEAFEAVNQRLVDGTFGIGFSETLNELPLEEWHGPIRSGLGLHLIRIDRRTDGRLPPLAEIRDVVSREWSNERRIENRDQLNQELLSTYEVVIEWPQSEQDAGQIGNAAGIGDATDDLESQGDRQ